MEKLMINIENVSKKYILGQIGGTTLRDELQRFAAKIRHKEDPTKKIGVKDYNKGDTFLALDGVSFTVRKGERVGVIGHNGAGKSTLLKLISRVTAPTAGYIGLNGRIASMLEVGTGFHPELTGRENIYMNGAILGMTKKEINAKMEDIIEFSECRQFIDTPVKRYSSGMYVKLAFSVAAHLDSEIMIMDEVLAVGDVKFQQKCIKKMNDVSREENRTILYVSHNMSTIRQLCNRVIVLNHGKIIFDGETEAGIMKYMGISDGGGFPVEYDFSQAKREYHFGQQFKIMGMKFLNKSEASYEVGEDALLEVHYRSIVKMKDAKIIFTVRDINNVDKVASTISGPFSCEENEKGKMLLRLHLDGLSEEKYSLGFEVVKREPGTNYYIYDYLDDLVPFLITDQSEEKWVKKNWGTVRLPDVEILEI